MRIIFVRHGHPNYVDDCLTERGKLHAQAAAARLQYEGIGQIFSSTCGRAHETAEYTANLLGLPIEKCDFMREIRWGFTEESKTASVDDPWGLADAMVRSNESLLCPDWKETEPFCKNVMVGYVNNIAEETDAWLKGLGYQREGLYYRVRKDAGATERTIAVFGHGGASAAILSHIFNLPYPFVCTTMGPDYTGITVVTLPDEPGALVTPRFEILNDARHIQNLKMENV